MRDKVYAKRAEINARFNAERELFQKGFVSKRKLVAEQLQKALNDLIKKATKAGVVLDVESHWDYDDDDVESHWDYDGNRRHYTASAEVIVNDVGEIIDFNKKSVAKANVILDSLEDLNVRAQVVAELPAKERREEIMKLIEEIKNFKV